MEGRSGTWASELWSLHCPVGETEIEGERGGDGPQPRVMGVWETASRGLRVSQSIASVLVALQGTP